MTEKKKHVYRDVLGLEGLAKDKETLDNLNQFLVNKSGITEEGIRYDYYYDSSHGKFYVQRKEGIIDIGTVAPCLVDVNKIRFCEYKPKKFLKNNFKK